jgi:molecular chaperone HtpG
LDDPTSFAKRIHRIIGLGLDVDDVEEAESFGAMATNEVEAPPAAEGTSTSAVEEKYHTHFFRY